MGFFYQALKKASGIAPDVSEETLERPEPPAYPETAVRTVAAESHAAAPARTRQRFDLKLPLESLVAFLSPPVADENIIAMEQCRVLRTRIWEIMHNKKLKTLLLTSALPAEGKTLLAVNLAFALSQIENTRVLLVDVDLRRPSVSRFLNMELNKGLSTFLTTGDKFEDVCWTINDTLDVVPTQTVDEGSAELLHGQQMVDFLQHARQNYDVVVMDGPPLFPIVDAQVLAPLVDGAVLVVRANQTSYELSRQAAELLKAKFIGSILNGADVLKKSGYYGSYYGRYSPKGKKK